MDRKGPWEGYRRQAKRRPARCLLPAFLCAHIFIERETSGYEAAEKYSPKSCVLNFDTQMSSSQSEEWIIVFTREKNDISNQNCERFFFTCEKSDTSNQKPQRCVSCAPKFPPFLTACWAPLQRHSTRNVFLKEFSPVKEVKNISEMECNSFVCFTVDKENCGEPAKQQRKRKNNKT